MQLNSPSLFLSVIALLLSLFFSPTLWANSDLSLLERDSLTDRINTPFIGDLKDIRQRRVLRVLVSYNRTNFFDTTSGERGLEHDLLKEYEKFLNRGPREDRYKTHLVFLSRPFSNLFNELNAGRGDIIAAGLTITKERQPNVDYTNPYIKDISKILVSNTDTPPVTKLEELSGKQIIVVSNSSQIIYLEQCNQALGKLGLTPIEIIKANPLLEAEDLLEMVNAGLFEFTVVDNHIAELYQKKFTKLRVQNDFVFHYGGQVSWAINRNLPELKESLNEFIRQKAQPGKMLANMLYNRYFKDSYWIEQSPMSFAELDEDKCLQYYFELYSKFYDFNWYLIAALAYHESNYQQDTRSASNALGLMQIKMATARSKDVNIPNILNLEDNIHAGVKYLAFLRDYYFSDPKYTTENSINFALAAYNAGPGRITQIQNKAEELGFDRYKWFYNVEAVARKSIGTQTVDYVTNIQKKKVALETARMLSAKKQRLKNLRIHELEAQKNLPPLK